MRTAIYCRVSTSDQTVEPQLMELRSYATSRGMPITYEISDVISGTKMTREGLDRLLALVRNREIDAVLCVKLDRMARSLSHFAQIVAEFDRCDVALICTSQGIDTSKSNACGRLQMNVLSAVAEFERELISERTKAGLVAAKARGKILGHPSTKLVPDWRSRVILWRQRTGGKGLRELRADLGGVSLSTAARLAGEVAA